MAVSFDTWAELQAAVEAWSGIDVADAQAQEFIALAEDHFQLTVFTPDREAALSLAADAQGEALPADFRGFKSGPYVDGATDTVLQRLEPGDLRATYPDGATGTPRHYAIEGKTLLLGPTPSASVTVKASYWQTIPPLCEAMPSNWLLLAHPSLYLAGALAEAFAFHMDEARELKWIARRDAIVEAVNRAGSRRASNSGPLTASHSVGRIARIQA